MNKIQSEFSIGIIPLFNEKLNSGLLIGPILVPEEALELTKAHAKDMAEIKAKEKHHDKDYQKEYDRVYNGKEAEWAVRIHEGLPAPDLTVGHSKDYNIADICNYYGMAIGIKSSQLTHRNAAMVHKNPERPEIIISKNKDGWYIFGVASIDIMRNNQDINLIRLDPKDSKGGLTLSGYKKLIPINSFRYYLRNKNNEWRNTAQTLRQSTIAYNALAKEERNALITDREFRLLCYVQKNFPTI